MARTFCGGVPCALSPARRASLERLRRPCARCCAEGPSGAHHEGYGRRELGTVGARKRLVLPSETTAKSFPRDEADMLKLLTTSLSTGYGDHPEVGWRVLYLVGGQKRAISAASRLRWPVSVVHAKMFDL